MKSKLYIILLISTLFFTLSGCEKQRFYNYRKLLVKNNWKVNTFVNYSENKTLDIGEMIYNFEESGKLIRTVNNNTVHTSWTLSEDASYITIDVNVFKITHISRKTLSLRYGDVELFFIKI